MTNLYKLKQVGAPVRSGRSRHNVGIEFSRFESPAKTIEQMRDEVSKPTPIHKQS